MCIAESSLTSCIARMRTSSSEVLFLYTFIEYYAAAGVRARQAVLCVNIHKWHLFLHKNIKLLFLLFPEMFIICSQIIHSLFTISRKSCDILSSESERDQNQEQVRDSREATDLLSAKQKNIDFDQKTLKKA